MRKVLVGLLVAIGAVAYAQLPPSPFYCNDRAKPCVEMNSRNSFGQLVNVSSGVWALGYNSILGTNGTSALTWNNAGAVVIPTSLSVAGINVETQLTSIAASTASLKTKSDAVAVSTTAISGVANAALSRTVDGTVSAVMTFSTGVIVNVTPVSGACPSGATTQDDSYSYRCISGAWKRKAEVWTTY